MQWGESMMEWFKKYAPCFMFKPHLFSNERQTICCSFNVYFVEISDSGRQRSPLTDCLKGIQLVRENSKFIVKDV